MFEQVRVTGFRYRKINGERKLQQKDFTATVNPYNTNEKGVPKTRDEVVRELQEKAWAWEDEKEQQ